jgi:hypothetical protein
MNYKAELRNVKKTYEDSILGTKFNVLNIFSSILPVNSMSSLLLRFSENFLPKSAFAIKKYSKFFKLKRL